MYFPWFPLWSQNYFYPSNIFDFRNSFQNFIEVARKLDFGFHSSLNLGWRCRGRGSHDRNLAVSKELTLFLVTKNHKILIRRKKIVFYLLEIASNGMYVPLFLFEVRDTLVWNLELWLVIVWRRWAVTDDLVLRSLKQ